MKKNTTEHAEKLGSFKEKIKKLQTSNATTFSVASGAR